MANEITASIALTGSKNGVVANFRQAHTFTLTGVEIVPGIIQNIGTSTEQIVFPADLIAEGISYIALKNLDATNYIEVGLNTPVTQIFTRLQPGGIALLPVYDPTAAASPAYYAKAHSGACNLAIAAVGIT